ncbi:TIGR02391 family protein [Brevundimonas vesicularis]|uniref:TIGR02391 family protein n=1 Tax=Brevundimonas vesicularis TaxID=41276 RepID=UPI0022AC5A55|nr:TIGR02391 family protein [Brevundimonas vesicularis]
MQELITSIPDEETFLALEPEELGERVLLHLAARSNGDPKFSIHNEVNNIRADHRETYTNDVAVMRALTEAFAWLLSEGLIVADPEQNGTWNWISRRGKRAAQGGSLVDMKAARLLPKSSLHSRIRDIAWKNFLRGDYDVAVFQSMKALEIAVREAAGLDAGMLGVKLARAAFNPQNGPLTDPEVEDGEKQARMDLFAGALGSYKNPQSHRHVALDDPSEAAEQIILASHLLRIVDGRKMKTQFDSRKTLP